MLYKSVRSFRISCNICDIVSLKMIALCSKCATYRHIRSISTVFSYLNLQTPRGLFLVRPRFCKKTKTRVVHVVHKSSKMAASSPPFNLHPPEFVLFQPNIVYLHKHCRATADQQQSTVKTFSAQS